MGTYRLRCSLDVFSEPLPPEEGTKSVYADAFLLGALYRDEEGRVSRVLWRQKDSMAEGGVPPLEAILAASEIIAHHLRADEFPTEVLGRWEDFRDAVRDARTRPADEPVYEAQE